MPCLIAFSTSSCSSIGGRSAVQGVGSDVPIDLQPVFVVHLFDFQVVVDDFQFAAQRHAARGAVVQGMAQGVGQPRHQVAGALGVFVDQRAQVVERVEDEVRD